MIGKCNGEFADCFPKVMSIPARALTGWRSDQPNASQGLSGYFFSWTRAIFHFD